WLDRLVGHPGATLEVVQRRLRIADGALPAAATATRGPNIEAIKARAAAAPEPLAPERQPMTVTRVPAPTAAPAAEAPAAGDPVTDTVLDIVAELTGYPPELLDLDLDLEADLGVDTVKQAEVFAAVREKFDVERAPNLRLRDFPTLTHVIGWVRTKTGLTAPTTTPAAEAAQDVAPAPAAEAAQDVAPAEAPAAGDPVTDTVLDIVAELTGYPPELLDLDLDLEADLGVDTVKQAEVFAAVREKFDVERDPNLQLRDFPTLTHVIGWVRTKTGLTAPTTATTATATAPGEAPAEVPAARPAAIAPTVLGDLDAVDTLPRRVPVPVLRPDLDRCVPTGVQLGEGSRVVVMLDEGGVGHALVKRLARAQVTVLPIEPGTATDELLAQLSGWVAAGGVQGVYWLPGLDDEGPHDFDLAVWREALRRRVKALYATMRTLYDQAPFLVTATRLGGYHGYDAAGATAPMGGAVTGFAKSYQKEKPETLVKAIDLPASRKTAAIADILVEETLRDPGVVEIGRADDSRWGVALSERPFPARADDGAIVGEGITLGADSVVVVTGAAGSIVSAITADLAAVGGGTFHLLDLTPAPNPDDEDLRRFGTDKEGLKKDLAARLKDRGERPTPVLIERELAGIERRVSALAAIQAVEQAGGVARYHSVDLTDPDAVAEVVDVVRRDHGRIDVLLHAAGLEISRNLPEKEPREFDLVFDVKSDGWFNLTRAAMDLPVGATVVFSSVAGRFGNQGQTDYSAANDLLCKITSNLRRSGRTRGLALDWTAWGGIGMATRGSIPKIMEAAGVQMLPPEAGVAWIRRELLSTPFRGEVVVAGRLGLMAAEKHPTGGLDVTRLDLSHAGPMVGEVVADGVHDGLVVRTTLDPKEQPFLDDHRIDGTPLLPGVMGIEAFVEVAKLLAGERYAVAVEDVVFHAPFKFYRDEPRTLTVTALLVPDGDDLLAECRLTGERTLHGSAAPQVTVHFTGRVRLAAQAPQGQSREVPAHADSSIGPDLVYRFYFHGPAYQVVGEAWRANGAAVARLAEDLPADHVPGEQPTAIGPRLVELCFQTAGLYEAGTTGTLALPAGIQRLDLLAPAAGPGAGPLVAVAGRAEHGFDCAVLGADGRVVLRLDGYRTSPMPAPLADDIAVPLHEVMAG
ncbi:MAG TPA: SDR family NAD(P)-dependent oxidoreductase, partial [Kineosporiaceae bacterium]